MIRQFIKLIRVRQWIKNIFIFAPLVFSINFCQPGLIIKSLLVFLSFCLVSSGVYVLNDIIDREADKQHPDKKHRVIASGRLSITNAVITAAVLLGLSICIALTVNITTVFIVLGYLLLNIAYSFLLKNIAIIDVMTISLGFILRVIAGAAAIDVSVSNWLLLATLFIAIFLGFGKRKQELGLNNNGLNHRSVLLHYNVVLLDNFIMISATLAVITYSLYVMDPQTIQNLRTDKLIMTVPFVIFGLFRYLYIIHKKQKGGDPTEVVLKDKPLIVTVLLWGIMILFILYFANADIITL